MITTTFILIRGKRKDVFTKFYRNINGICLLLYAQKLTIVIPKMTDRNKNRIRQ